MYKNIYKSNQVVLQTDAALVIDNNERVAQEIESLNAKMPKKTHKAETKDTQDGFLGGLEAEKVDALLTDENDSSVIGQSQDSQADLETDNTQAQTILEEARKEAETIKAGAIEAANREAEEIKQQAMEAGKKQGFENGHDEGMLEIENLRKELEEEKRKLEKDYREMIDELEPEFVDTITRVYEHVFQVDLKNEHDVVMHLIENTMQKMDGNSNYLIHVSREDYPYVSMKKEELLNGAVPQNASVEIVEDVTLDANDCMIETDSGIFDCGLGTQMEELSQKLKLLSYSKE